MITNFYFQAHMKFPNDYPYNPPSVLQSTLFNNKISVSANNIALFNPHGWMSMVSLKVSNFYAHLSVYQCPI
jgi:ubiquitin-protein ligase